MSENCFMNHYIPQMSTTKTKNKISNVISSKRKDRDLLKKFNKSNRIINQLQIT